MEILRPLAVRHLRMMSSLQWRLMHSLLLLFFAFLLLCAIGLLKRWNWARRCFIGYMVFNVAYMLLLLLVGVSAMPDAFGVGLAVFAACFMALLGWIGKKLLSAPIVAEFRNERSSR
ncbi:MAG: hypothetical protein LBB65_06035 [Burkholderiales bacterium]|nr:hypothetical protein [Burkholderiales bacterium]